MTQSSLEPMHVPIVDLATSHASIQPMLREVAIEVLDSFAYIGGEYVSAFEQQIAHFIGAPHAIGVSSGTDALLAALMAHDIGPGDEVITTPMTFFASAGAIARLGATPRFVDINPRTFNLDPQAVEDAITPRTRGILPVHLFGQMCDMRALCDIAQRHGLWLVEDAAQAIGATRDGLSAGAAADVGCFSFFPTKNLGGAGDGGLVTCDDSALAERIRVLCRHGAKPKYVHHVVGANFRLDALQAAMLSVKLGALPDWTAQRRQNAAYYDEMLHGVVQTPHIPQGSQSVYHHYCILTPHRDALADSLRALGVGCAIYYPRPLHVQSCFESMGYVWGDLPMAEQASQQILALPVWPGMNEAQREHVVRCVRASLA
jgi:dTDP-4-amino-4,6-dideoxygalactose transaminase